MLGVTWVSVVSPDFPLDVIDTNGIVYEMMHGRTAWFSHHYRDEELREVERILQTSPERVYIFFKITA